MTAAADTFPGGTAVSRVRVYDWPAADGLHGGSPHLHTTSTEAYVVVAGEGAVQTLSGDGAAEHPLAPGSMLWFTPGTVHRLINTRDLEVLVVMGNAGLPEAGDAIFTFPPAVLADPAAYAAAATLPASSDPQVVAEAARRRRDLAIEGYLALRERVRADGPGALSELYYAAAALVRDRVPDWRERWRDGPLARAVDTGDHLDALGAGKCEHLAESGVRNATPAASRFGMCGHLSRWDATPR
ncbi:cupin domain-containing protein [Natronosporangium hydrolyticum]|uniref:Cupin domain-containing protein n=1 Tax=Natronosporangium hydrolyticum TaxID=2811111 RepID=A0A895YIX8_9ACTN|nr:cupin domain-containing protein [Natronosporangium hydrolyticum]QSB13728.1 cupin domain-containing protein [Natronosporangium hydrolyticum]